MLPAASMRPMTRFVFDDELVDICDAGVCRRNRRSPDICFRPWAAQNLDDRRQGERQLPNRSPRPRSKKRRADDRPVAILRRFQKRRRRIIGQRRGPPVPMRPR